MAQERRQPLPKQASREADRLAGAVNSRMDHERSVYDTTRTPATDASGSPVVTIPAAGTATLQHNLGYEPNGWRVADRNVAGSVWRTAWDASTLTLATDAVAPITVRVEVF